MTFELSFAELQTPLFLQGVNHGVKLPKVNSHNPSVRLYWDDELDKLVVIFKESVAIIPTANVASMTPKDATHFKSYVLRSQMDELKEPVKSSPIPRGRVKAQASTPTSHVFGEDKQ